MSEVLRERRGHIEVLTINRPEARNAINGAVSLAFAAAFDELEVDDDCWVVIVTGSGDKAFSAGMDLKAFAAGEAADIMGAKGGFGGIAQRGFAKPIIAAVNGSALAGGCEIMLACDLVVAVESAKFGIPEVKLALTGDTIDARRALELGLINRVVPQEKLMDEALELANTIAKNAPLAVRASKRVMQKAGELPDADGWPINNAAIPEVFGSADAMEGPVAFAEKREPVWTGK
jgi:enoyl-CoA hydratase/carnithine racemase